MLKVFKIDRLAPDDWERLKALRIKSAIDSPEAFATSLEVMRNRPREFWNQQIKQMACFTVYTVEHGKNKDLGLVRGAIDPHLKSQVWLLGMWVDPVARGNNLGQQLTQKVIEWGRNINASILKLEVISTNRFAVNLYERVGFTLTGHSTSRSTPLRHLVDVEYEYFL